LGQSFRWVFPPPKPSSRHQVRAGHEISSPAGPDPDPAKPIADGVGHGRVAPKISPNDQHKRRASARANVIPAEWRTAIRQFNGIVGASATVISQEISRARRLNLQEIIAQTPGYN